MEEIYERVWQDGKKILTENLVEGEKVYEENLLEKNDGEFREWNPERSKLGAAIKKGLPETYLKNDSKVLYLGAASGTTPSHVSDICSEGIVFGVEYSPKVMNQLLTLSKKRENLVPVLGDARKPEEYSGIVDRVDVIFQDVAQPDQYRIFNKNAEKFLREGGHGLIALKGRSISSSEPLEKVFREQEEKISQKYRIIWKSKLEPFEKDHMFFLVEK